jgi:hypothetical protein
LLALWSSHVSVAVARDRPVLSDCRIHGREGSFVQDPFATYVLCQCGV